MPGASYTPGLDYIVATIDALLLKLRLGDETTDAAVVGVCVGSPEGQVVGSPGDVRIAIPGEVGGAVGLWQKETGELDEFGWVEIGGGGGGSGTLQEAIDNQGVVPTEQSIVTSVDLNGGTGAWEFRDAADSPIVTIADVDGFTISQQLRLDGTISPGALAAGNNNDYAPVGGTTANSERLTPNAAGSTITGIAGGAAGRMLVLENVSTTIPIGLTHQDGASVAANQFLLPNGASYSIPPNSAVTLWYDATSSRWRLAHPAAWPAPGSYIWTFASAGGPADGIIRTTDATPVFRTWCTLPAVGDTVNYLACFYGVRDNGDDCLFRQSAGGFGRNAIGSNGINPVAGVVTSGYDETGTAAAPWNNLVANPVGWGGGVNFQPGGNIIQVAFNGALGENVEWRCVIIATPFYGALLSL